MQDEVKNEMVPDSNTKKKFKNGMVPDSKTKNKNFYVSQIPRPPFLYEIINFNPKSRGFSTFRGFLSVSIIDNIIRMSAYK